MSYREVRIARAELDTLSDRQIEQKLESGGLYLRATIQYHEEPGTRDMVYSQGGPCLCGKCRPIDPVKQRLEALERVVEAARLVSNSLFESPSMNNNIVLGDEEQWELLRQSLEALDKLCETK